MRSARRSPSRLFGFVAVAALLLGVFATSTGTAAASSLSITPVSSSQWGPDTSGYEHIVGEVQNTGTVTASLIEIDFAFYNASDAVVGSDYTFATVDPLAPGEKSPFEDIFTPPPDYTHYSITSVSPSASTIAANRNFATVVTDTYTDGSGYRNIAGTITNLNTTTADLVEAVFTFYNSSGTVVAQNYAYADTANANIAAGQSASFDEALSPEDPTYSSYAMLVQSTSPPAPPPAPAVTSLSPPAGPAGGGTTVTIGGSGFDGVQSVMFGAVAATSFTVVSSNQLTAVAPAGSGTVAVSVEGSYGASPSSAAGTFTYLAPAPSISSISPVTGTTDGGTTVTIYGSNFTGATAVDFASTPATGFTVVSSSEITAVAPAGAAGKVDLAVTGPGGTSAQNPGDVYTYAALTPAISSISPASGLLAGGNTVMLSGTNFDGATAVDFGSTPATNFQVVADTAITATVPAYSFPGLVEVSVTTPSGMSASSSGAAYLYLPPATYEAVSPFRICDTRSLNPSELTGLNDQCQGKTLQPGGSITIQVAGTSPNGASNGEVPANAVAAILDVTATNTTGASYLSLYPAGVSSPYTSDLNWSPGSTRSDLVEVALGRNGQVVLYNNAGATDVLVDVQGYYVPAPTSTNPSPRVTQVTNHLCQSGTGATQGPCPATTSTLRTVTLAPGTALSLRHLPPQLLTGLARLLPGDAAPLLEWVCRGD